MSSPAVIAEVAAVSAIIAAGVTGALTYALGVHERLRSLREEYMILACVDFARMTMEWCDRVDAVLVPIAIGLPAVSGPGPQLAAQTMLVVREQVLKEISDWNSATGAFEVAVQSNAPRSEIDSLGQAIKDRSNRVLAVLREEIAK